MSYGKVLILSEKFGVGHEMAAFAISKGIRKLSPQTEVKIINFFQQFQPYLSRMTVKLYLKALDITPEIWGYFYERERNKKKATVVKKMIQMGASFILREIIEREKPDMIVCTHPFPCCVASRLKRKGLSVPLVAVITDFDVHGFWINEGVDAYIIAHEFMMKSMMKFGVDPGKIYPTGIPIDPNFDTFHGKIAAKKMLGFKEDLPLVLMAGGGLGINGLDVSFVESLSHAPLQLAVICGKNQSLQRNLLALTHHNNLDNIKVYGFVENMWDFMEAADLIITKAGGLTLAEALARELPVVIYNPLPGQEERNAEFLLKNGAARRARNRDVLLKLAINLLQDEEKLSRIKNKEAQLKKLFSAKKAAAILLNLMEEKNDLMEMVVD
ncbi:MAG: processive 1,2-diacylglycerol beta-glucosyltransferase [Thermoanaerobacteraceae bacterium]|jgi:processive 1,2-diacylglycerol beta-glucosyltransferase|nr:processive 1,2-diacylglycerol beta-glucosyltransferase [Thermoanaerobacteraceae bacterium]